MSETQQNQIIAFVATSLSILQEEGFTRGQALLALRASVAALLGSVFEFELEEPGVHSFVQDTIRVAFKCLYPPEIVT